MAIAALLLAATVYAAEPIKVAAPSFQGVGLDAAKAAFFSDFLAQQLTTAGLRVTTSSEIATLLGLERQKQLLACGESSSDCMAELAGALGVDAVITGSVAKTESGSYAVALKIISAKDARPLSVVASRLKNDDAVYDFFSEQAPRMAADVTRALRGEAAPPKIEEKPPVAVVEEPASSSSKRWLPLPIGAALIGGGAVFLLMANSDADRIRGGGSDAPVEAELASSLNAGRAKQSVGVALLGAGIGTAAAGGALMAMGDDAHRRAWVPIAAGGAAAVGGGIFYALAKGTENAVRSGESIDGAQALNDAIAKGHNQELVAFGLLGGGVGAAVTGGLFMAFGGESQTHVSFELTGEHAQLAFSGVFP